MTRFASALGAVLAVVTLGLLACPVAHAHAVLVASDPVDGAKLPSSPPLVRLTFDESVRLIPAAVQVISGTGARVDTGAALEPGGSVIDIALPEDLPAGSYTAVWRVISADTHEVSGSISFGVREDALAAAAPAAAGADPLGPAADVARGVVYLGVVLGVGLPLVCRFAWPWALRARRLQWLLRLGWAALIVGTAAGLALAGPRALGLGWSGVVEGDGFAQTIDTRTGGIALTRMALVAGFVLISGSVVGPGRSAASRGARGAVSAILAAGVAVTVAADGHAGVGDDAWLATTVTAVHVLAMAMWLGGLLALLVAVLADDRAGDLHAWSHGAFLCVAALVLTGEYQAWRQIDPVESLWTTGYGVTLLVKLAAVALMLAAAYASRRRLAGGAIRRSVAVEAAVGVIVVAITTVLVAQPPARAVFGPPVTVNAPLDRGRRAEVHISSTRRGPLTIEVAVLGADGAPAAPRSVEASLASDDAGIASLPVRLKPGGVGRWRSTYATAPRPGVWTLRITADFTPVDVAATTAIFRVW